MRASRKNSSFADVALPVPVERLFTYRIPSEAAGTPSPGCRVIVPFGRRKLTGYVVRLRDRPPAGVKLREISSIIDPEPLLGEHLLNLARWLSEYYVHPLGEVLRAMLPPGLKGRGRGSPDDERDGSFPEEKMKPELTIEQRAAWEAVSGALSSGGPHSFLLHGVTGSGKTEVYLRCIEESLRLGRSALVLIPEIALIPQTTSRFRLRFGRGVAVLHSRLTGAQRHSIWLGAARGELRVVIGARSAVFAPMRDLGIIVVDEEHDGSYKQEEKPHYHAVGAAAFRARDEGCVLLMGSATPSLETYLEASQGKHRLFKLGSRPIGALLPAVEIVDMRGREGLLSDELLDALAGCLALGEQAIVLLNRRGHANYVQCRSCGWIEECPRCSISLTYHSRGHKLLCHYCGHAHASPDRCGKCGEYGLRHAGAGTQRVEMEIANLVPGARVLRMDLDTTRGKQGHLTLLERFARGEGNVLLGTQMVAKGHHYPKVTLVGILTADAGLGFPDFRAAERTFQLLHQAAGRTGRGDRPGRVIVQTLAPSHYVFDYLPPHDFEGFARAELRIRDELGYPPAGRLVLVTVSSTARERAYEGASRAGEAIAKAVRGQADVLGPTPALIERLRGSYRVQLLVRGHLDAAAKKRMVRAAGKAVAELARTSVQWNVDPLSTT